MTTEIISFGKRHLEAKRFEQPRNEWSKPSGGLWGSTYIPNGRYASEWHEWCVAERFPIKEDTAVVFELKPSARVLEIDSYEDLERMMQGHMAGEWHEGSTNPDFEKLRAEGFDAIHLTEKGRRETRLSKPFSLNSWDVESWLVLSFDSIARQRPFDPGSRAAYRP